MGPHQKTILIFSNHFYPAWKLGGPIQSLKNMTDVLSEKLNIYAICSAYDLNENTPLSSVKRGVWNKVINIKVRYLDFKELRYSTIKGLIKECNPDSIYLNGLFSLTFVVYPLIVWKFQKNKKSRLILSPRGMLQSGALKSKTLKKKIFIGSLKFFQLHRNIEWHATDVQECLDIKKHFGKDVYVTIAPNIPKAPYTKPTESTKLPGELKMIYLSLIAEKKNLHLALKWIKELNIPLIFDIYGPIKDKNYWNKCKQLMINMPNGIRVNYKGEVMPDKVQEKFSEYHSLLLPTKGENFGHAIYESLSVGRPVIISSETPWKNLQEKKAGYTIHLDDEEQFKSAIKSLYLLDECGYNILSINAHAVAYKYWQENDFKSLYLHLFN